MCGIVGIFDVRERRTIPKSVIEVMNSSQRHRGPDGFGFHIEPGLAFGHRRLSIIDVAGGHQPLFNEDDTVAVTFNGEIYNFQPLTDELKKLGHKFHTHSDTEVIVHAWEEWGERSVDRFNGMYAFAIWDRNKRCIFLARDRLGIKPLYYALIPSGYFLFGSELKSLLAHPGLPREVDASSVEDYFTFGYVPDPKTILKHTRKLAPGYTLLVKGGQGGEPVPRRYWDVVLEPTAAKRDAHEIERELIERLQASVKSQLISEVPLGAFLSGGVDSSAVVAMMARSSDRVLTCSIKFKNEAFDESAYADLVARHCGSDHYVSEVDTDDFALLDKLVSLYDEPFADSSALPTYRVCELARRRVTVALSGDGGDELFGGYRRYRFHALEESMRSLIPSSIRVPLFSFLGNIYPKLDWAPRVVRGKSTFEALGRDSLEGYLHGVSIYDAKQRRRLFSDDLHKKLAGYRSLEVFKEHAANAPSGGGLPLAQYLDFKTYLPGDILTKVDRASMAHSLEVRVPLLDHTFVEWVGTLPASLKQSGRAGKVVFKKSLEPYLPEEILYRPKMGFAVPLAQWFRGPLRDRVRATLLGDRLAASGLFRAEVLGEIVAQHERGQRDHGSIIWALLMFDGFLKTASA
jgi:asparagine synthase (glutamine-hydrolysing)